MTPVESSSLAQIGYEATARKLYVEFKDGRTYVYADVTAQTVRELIGADSKGAYLNREIKPNHACRQVLR